MEGDRLLLCGRSHILADLLGGGNLQQVAGLARQGALHHQSALLSIHRQHLNLPKLGTHVAHLQCKDAVARAAGRQRAVCASWARLGGSWAAQRTPLCTRSDCRRAAAGARRVPGAQRRSAGSAALLPPPPSLPLCRVENASKTEPCVRTWPAALRPGNTRPGVEPGPVEPANRAGGNEHIS